MFGVEHACQPCFAHLLKRAAELDITLPHTLFLNEEGTETCAQQVRNALDIRLGPTIKGLARHCQVMVYVGPEEALRTVFADRGYNVGVKLSVPSTAKFYIAHKRETSHTLFTQNTIILSGLQSEHNLLSQLYTLKFAGVDISKVKILGDPNYFKSQIKKDMALIREQIGDVPKILIIAGNSDFYRKQVGARPDVCQHAEKRVEGGIVSVSYFPFTKTSGGAEGILILDMPYGETMALMTECLIEMGCFTIFNGGAGGALPGKGFKVGDILHIKASLKDGEKVVLDPRGVFPGAERLREGLHHHVDSPLAETMPLIQSFLHQGAEIIDVETHYLIKAVNKAIARGMPVNIYNILSVSDVVCEHALRTIGKDNAFRDVTLELDLFIEQSNRLMIDIRATVSVQPTITLSEDGCGEDIEADASVGPSVSL